MMNTRTGSNGSAEKHVRDCHRKTRHRFSAEEKIRIVLDGLRGEHSLSELCRREGIAESLYYNWSKEFLEAGKKRLSGDTQRQATSGEVSNLKRETRDLKEALAAMEEKKPKVPVLLAYMAPDGLMADKDEATLALDIGSTSSAYRIGHHLCH